jgi:hypothetical protein
LRKLRKISDYKLDISVLNRVCIITDLKKKITYNVPFELIIKTFTHDRLESVEYDD